MTDSQLRRKCGTEKETSAHVLCECVALATLRHTYLDSFSLDPEDVRSLGTIWNSIKGTELLCDLDSSLRGTNGMSKGPTCIGIETALNSSLLYPQWILQD